MNRFNSGVSKEYSKTHRHLAIIEVDDLGSKTFMHIFSGSEAMSVMHVLVIDFEGVGAMVQTDGYFEISWVVYLFDSIIVQKVVLFLLLLELDMELSILFLFFHNYHLSYNILKHLFERHCILALSHDFPEHIFYSNKV